MIAPDQDLDALFKRLHLANARRVWRDLVQRAERESWSYRDFLTLLVTEEIAHRQQTRLARLTRRAHPFLKTIDDFNFINRRCGAHARLGARADFVTEGRSLIFSARQGAGKRTWRSPSRAARFRTASMPSSRPRPRSSTTCPRRSRRAARAGAADLHTSGRLGRRRGGYLTYGRCANMLFHVVNERHRRHRAMIFTTNKALKGVGPRPARRGPRAGDHRSRPSAVA